MPDKTILVWLWVMALVPGSLAADHKAEGKIFFSELSQMVLKDNLSIQAARSQWQAAKERVPQARSWPDPMLGFAVFQEELHTRGGPLEKKISFSQKLPFWGKRTLQGTIEEHKAYMAEQAYRAKSLDVLSRTANAYFELYYLDQAIVVNEELSDQLRSFSRVAERKFSTGRQTQASVYRAQVELAKILNDLMTFKQKRVSMLARLNALLDRPSSTPVMPAASETISNPFNSKELKLSALQNRPELLAARLMVSKSKAVRSLAYRSFFPDLTLGYERSQIGAGAASMAFDGKDAEAFQFQLNLPVWLNRLIPKANEAKALQQSSQALVKDWENRTSADVADVLVRVQTAQRLAAMYQSTVLPQAKEALKSSQRGYEAAHVSFLDLLDSVRSLLTFELDYYRSIADYHQSLAELNRIVGAGLVPARMEGNNE